MGDTQRIAFFDFDNTIYAGYTYMDFIEYVSKYELRDDDYQKRVFEIIENTKDYNEIVIKIAEIVKEVSKNMNHSDFIKFCNLSCNSNKILGWVKPVMQFLSDNGFENIIVSASFNEMMAESVEILNFDKVYCSEMEIVDGVLTGEIKLLLNHDKKIEVIKRELNLDEFFSVAFGDSMGDVPMLENVDLPFLVRSDDDIVTDYAKERNWFIGSDPEKIIENIKLNLYKTK